MTKKVEITEVATLAQIIEAYGKDVASDITEPGIWEIKSGSRGEVEEVVMNCEYLEIDELVSEEDDLDEEEKEMFLEELEEFYEVEGMMEDCGCPGFGVFYFEEAYSLFVKVEEV